MSSNKHHGDPLENEIRRDPVRGADEVRDNQPGSKGDGSVNRAGSGSRTEEEDTSGQIVRSGGQKPKRADDEATRTSEGIEPGHSNY
jgi:hypothetical protein